MTAIIHFITEQVSLCMGGTGRDPRTIDTLLAESWSRVLVVTSMFVVQDNSEESLFPGFRHNMCILHLYSLWLRIIIRLSPSQEYVAVYSS